MPYLFKSRNYTSVLTEFYLAAHYVRNLLIERMVFIYGLQKENFVVCFYGTPR